MLADKNKVAKVNGLNQNFRFSESAHLNRYMKVMDNTPIPWEDSIMILLNQSDTVTGILNDEIPYRENQNFSQSITSLRHINSNRQFPAAPLNQSICKKCEYRKHHIDDPGLSGMAKCFAHHRQITENQLNHLPPSTQKFLVDQENLSEIHIRYKVATIPASTMRIFTANHDPFQCNLEHREAINRRCQFVNLY